MDKPKISVIVPIYKVEPYLRRCLDSIVEQTYRNLEIILVDDGSPDNCGRICDEYATKDCRFVVLHTVNCGVYSARNRALDISTGDYIGFVDADDWLELQMYEKLLALMQKYNADISQCGTVNEGDYVQTRSINIGCVKTYQRDELIGAMFREEITHGLINKLFRAAIWNGIRFPTEYYHADAMMITQADMFCNIFVRTDSVLYHYNTTNTSITRGKKKPLHIKSMEKLFETYLSASEKSMEGSFFICREIPCTGRLIPPSKDISIKMSIQHIRYMHIIFKKCWDAARETEGYSRSPWTKKVLWNIYACFPTVASFFVYVCGCARVILKIVEVK